MKKLFAVVVVLVLVSILFSVSASADVNSRVAIIISIDTEADKVICKDACDITWEFYGSEDFDVGDLVVLTMWDSETPESIFDDEIVDVVYSGFVAADIH